MQEAVRKQAQAEQLVAGMSSVVERAGQTETALSEDAVAA